MNRVFITQYSVVSPIGNKSDIFRKNLFNASTGIVPANALHNSLNIPLNALGLVNLQEIESDSKIPEIAWNYKVSHFLNHLSRNLNGLSKIREICAVVLGSDVYDIIDKSYELQSQALEGRFSYEGELKSNCAKVLSEYLNSHWGISCAPNNILSINKTCISGITSISTAAQLIKAGVWKRAVVGCVEGITSLIPLVLLSSVGALSKRQVAPQFASCPYSIERDGFIKGEGGALFLVESERSLSETKNIPLAEVLGFSQNNDGFRLSDGRDDCKYTQKVIKRAIENSKINLNEIDYINSHGTSTKMNDILETKAIKSVFGEYAYNIPISSLKSKIGHATTACASVEIAASIEMMQSSLISPTCNLNKPDPDCDLDYVPNFPREMNINHFLKLSFGLGGQNAAIVIKNPNAVS